MRVGVFSPQTHMHTHTRMHKHIHMHACTNTYMHAHMYRHAVFFFFRKGVDWHYIDFYSPVKEIQRAYLLQRNLNEWDFLKQDNSPIVLVTCRGSI